MSFEKYLLVKRLLISGECQWFSLPLEYILAGMPQALTRGFPTLIMGCSALVLEAGEKVIRCALMGGSKIQNATFLKVKASRGHPGSKGSSRGCLFSSQHWISNAKIKDPQKQYLSPNRKVTSVKEDHFISLEDPDVTYSPENMCKVSADGKCKWLKVPAEAFSTTDSEKKGIQSGKGSTGKTNIPNSGVTNIK